MKEGREQYYDNSSRITVHNNRMGRASHQHQAERQDGWLDYCASREAFPGLIDRHVDSISPCRASFGLGNKLDHRM